MSGGAVDAVCLALAGFLRYNSGVADGGSEVETVPDPMKEEMKEVALRMRGEVSEGVCAEALAMVFGDELVKSWDGLVKGVLVKYREMQERGGARSMLVV
uniref:Uncharacterized protein n=1 Tax=Calcidiscus leptoporus TaxID=127549 RepID=A0A7S0P6F3_9EUKA